MTRTEMWCECGWAEEDACVREPTYTHDDKGIFLCSECARNCYEEEDCSPSDGFIYSKDDEDDYEPEDAEDLIEWLHTPEEPTVELVVKVIEVRADEEDPDLVLVTLDAVDVDFTYITVQFPQNEVPFVGEKFTLKLERKYD